MALLNGFPQLPSHGEVPVCEVNGLYCSLPQDYSNISTFSNSINEHPVIYVTRDANVKRDEALPMYMEVQDNFFKKITSVWYKRGYLDALRIAANPAVNTERPLLAWIASTLLKITNEFFRIRNFMQPHLKEIGPNMIAKYSNTRDWESSAIRCIAWHPHTTKIAVASSDDLIKVYGSGIKLVSTLKCHSQSNVSAMAWRTNSASELAVGCEAGVIVWTVDPNSIFAKPSSSNAVVLKRSCHSPVTDVCWSPNGDVLLSTSAADCSMLVWDVAFEAAVPVRRVAGGGVAFTRWSADGTKLFAATAGIIFRVWDTVDCWSPERWCTRGGRVAAACWTTHNVLLFAAEGEALVYALCFKEANLFAGDKNIPNKAQPVLDLTKVELPSGEVLGGAVLDLQCDPHGRHLAVTFEHSPLVAIFTTLFTANLQINPCCLVRGMGSEIPNVISFQKNFLDGSCLAIGWSSGRLQHFPIICSNV